MVAIATGDHKKRKLLLNLKCFPHLNYKLILVVFIVNIYLLNKQSIMVHYLIGGKTILYALNNSNLFQNTC